MANYVIKVTVDGTDVSIKDAETSRNLSNHVSNKNNPHKVTAAQTGALPLNGGTMKGQILTSFKNSVAIGSLQADAHTIPDLAEELRYSSGCMGSAQIDEAYGQIPKGWYNFIWIPHRTGGKNGFADGDNCNFGNLILLDLVPIQNQVWVIHYENNKIREIYSIRNSSITNARIDSITNR